MKADNGAEFNWKELLNRINMQNVIPVIGEGLYWVQTPDLYFTCPEKPSNDHVLVSQKTEKEAEPSI